MDSIQQEKICRLEQAIQELQTRNLDRDLLGEMKEQLLGSRTSQEAYGILAHDAPRIFPGVAGALYLRKDQAHETFERVAAWGGFKQRRRAFTQDECRCLQRMKPHHVEFRHARGPVCHHVSRARKGSYLCVPLLTDGVALGVLHMKSADDVLTPWSRKLAEELGNYCAILLANLRKCEMLSEQAVRDPLTRLFNRRFMEESLRRELAARAQRPVGVIMIDIDHFKKYNTKFTHDGGDQLLRSFSAFLQKQIRPGDVACRYGGEEFMLILPGASLEATEHRAEKLRRDVKKLKVYHKDRPLGRITLSLGVAISKPGGEMEQVLEGAVSALRQAKESGRDRVVIAPHAPVRRRPRRPHHEKLGGTRNGACVPK